MRLSEYRGEDALDILAELLEPAAEIFGDKEFSRIYKEQQMLQAVKYTLKAHKKAILTILAILDGEDPETYSPGLLTLPRQVLEIFNDLELVSLFQSQAQNTDKTSSGPATEITEAREQ